MNRGEFSDVFVALGRQIQPISGGPDGKAQRKRLEPLLSQIPQEVALDMIASIVSDYDETKDPYGRLKPKLSTFERKLNVMLRSGYTANWLQELRHGSVVELLSDRDRHGIIEKSEQQQMVWTLAESRYTGTPHWAVVWQEDHAMNPWQLCRPDVGANKIREWWANWNNGIYDGPLPFGAIKEAADKYEIDLKTDWPFRMLDGVAAPKLERPEKVVTGASSLAEVLPAFTPGENIGKETGDENVPF